MTQFLLTRVRWLLSCHSHHHTRHRRRQHSRLCYTQIFVIMTTLLATLTSPSSSGSSGASLHKRQYDINTLPLIHRDYIFENNGGVRGIDRVKSDARIDVDDEKDNFDVTKSSEVLKRESAGVNLLKSSKDALIITKKSYLKKDWCKTEPLIQRIKEPGCVTQTIVNRFCYGQCNSFYIPKDSTATKTEDNAFKSCSFCKPKRFRWITITLKCPNLNPPFKRKRVQRIKKCKCISEILQS
ncbi:hypothetical protein CHUAL_012416 [Chamberlinius hualienensis]